MEGKVAMEPIQTSTARICASDRRGFTLVEIALVLLIAGIAAGMVRLSMRRSLARSSWQNLVQQVSVLDERCRHHCKSRDAETDLMVDVWGGYIESTLSGATHRVNATKNWHIAKILLADEIVKDGKATIRYTPDGYSPTFGVQFEDVQAGDYRWLLVLGLTGGLYEFEQEDDIRALVDFTARSDTR